jgi:hypothetical protein
VEIKQQLAAFRTLDPASLSEAEVRALVPTLLLLIEQLVQRDAERDRELQRLRDEVARLKGQSPRPKFPPPGGSADDPT